jgi:hypothetical protein
MENTWGCAAAWREGVPHLPNEAASEAWSIAHQRAATSQA